MKKFSFKTLRERVTISLMVIVASTAIAVGIHTVLAAPTQAPPHGNVSPNFSGMTITGGGEIVTKDASGVQTLSIDGAMGDIYSKYIRVEDYLEVIGHIANRTGPITLRGITSFTGQAGGKISMKNSSDVETVAIDGDNGTLSLKNTSGEPRINLDPKNEFINIKVGASERIRLSSNDLSVILRDASNKIRMILNSAQGYMGLHDASEVERIILKGADGTGVFQGDLETKALFKAMRASINGILEITGAISNPSGNVMINDAVDVQGKMIFKDPATGNTTVEIDPAGVGGVGAIKLNRAADGALGLWLNPYTVSVKRPSSVTESIVLDGNENMIKVKDKNDQRVDRVTITDTDIKLFNNVYPNSASPTLTMDVATGLLWALTGISTSGDISAKNINATGTINIKGVPVGGGGGCSATTDCTSKNVSASGYVIAGSYFSAPTLYSTSQYNAGTISTNGLSASGVVSAGSYFSSSLAYLTSILSNSIAANVVSTTTLYVNGQQITKGSYYMKETPGSSSSLTITASNKAYQNVSCDPGGIVIACGGNSTDAPWGIQFNGSYKLSNTICTASWKNHTSSTQTFPAYANAYCYAP